MGPRSAFERPAPRIGPRIHGEDGEIREKDSHGNDPQNIPG